MALSNSDLDELHMAYITDNFKRFELGFSDSA